MAEIYIPTEQYRAAVNAIAALTGIDNDDVKITLDEEANIWPASIREIIKAKKTPGSFLPGVLLEICQTIEIRSYAERERSRRQCSGP